MGKTITEATQRDALPWACLVKQPSPYQALSICPKAQAFKCGHAHRGLVLRCILQDTRFENLRNHLET